MIHPSLYLSMLGHAADQTQSQRAQTQSQRQRQDRDLEMARENAEKALERAVVVTMDGQVVDPDSNENNEEARPQGWYSRLSFWIWPFWQFLYSVYMVFIACYFPCGGIDTLRCWCVVWGILCFVCNVLYPLKGWNLTDHVMVIFLTLYIRGSSAVFPNWPHWDEELCNSQVFYPAAYSLVCAMGITITLTLIGVWKSRRKWFHPDTLRGCCGNQ